MRAPSIAVQCSGVTKSFPAGGGLVEVLHGINFEAPAGELTTLVGPSGCGKTTLISIIAGILSPTAGMVETCGIPITQRSGGTWAPTYLVRDNDGIYGHADSGRPGRIPMLNA